MGRVSMMLKERKLILLICISLLMISVGLKTVHAFEEDDYNLEYEYINVKDMAQAKVSSKEEKTGVINTLLTGINYGVIKETEMPSVVKETEMPVIESVAAQQEVPRRVWYLPTEIGRVTQNPSFGHVAYDITSPRGSQEPIFPIANGVISNIYRDAAGALIVTVLHDVDGQKYTSQYVHLSRYAAGLYVGKPVTINDSLGQMGTTGRSTGVHLHIAVLDCALFDPNDGNCSNLNGFFNYGKRRLGQGFIGLGSVVNVPAEWNNR